MLEEAGCGNEEGKLTKNFKALYTLNQNLLLRSKAEIVLFILSFIKVYLCLKLEAECQNSIYVSYMPLLRVFPERWETGSPENPVRNCLWISSSI